MGDETTFCGAFVWSVAECFYTPAITHKGIQDHQKRSCVRWGPVCAINYSTSDYLKLASRIPATREGAFSDGGAHTMTGLVRSTSTPSAGGNAFEVSVCAVSASQISEVHEQVLVPCDVPCNTSRGLLSLIHI